MVSSGNLYELAIRYLLQDRRKVVFVDERRLAAVDLQGGQTERRNEVLKSEQGRPVLADHVDVVSGASERFGFDYIAS